MLLNVQYMEKEKEKKILDILKNACQPSTEHGFLS